MSMLTIRAPDNLCGAGSFYNDRPIETQPLDSAWGARHELHDRSRPLDVERAVLLVVVERRAGWRLLLGGCCVGKHERHSASATTATAEASQAPPAKANKRGIAQPDRVWWFSRR